MTFVTLHPTAEQYDEAESRVASTQNYARSMRGKEAQQVGFLGEIVVRDELHRRGVRYAELLTTRHDGMIDTYRVEIKTKDRTAPPRLNYEASIADYNRDHQDVAYYIFVSLLRDRHGHSSDIRRFTAATILGVADRDTILNRGVFRRAGEVDPSNGWTVTIDCVNIRHDALIPLDVICVEWMKGARMIWVQGETEGGSFGQLVADRAAAEEFRVRLDAVSRRPVRWQVVEVQATESRAAHAEAQARLKEI